MTEKLLTETFAFEMAKKDARIKELENERELYRSQLMMERDTFLGWPVRMWFEIRNWLLAHGVPEQSPLSVLSKLAEQAEIRRRIF